MKTKIILLTLLIFYISNLFSQVTQKQFVSLAETVKILEDDRDSLNVKYRDVALARENFENKILKMYISIFADMELTVKDAFDKTDVISVSATYQQVIKSIITLHNEITKINNFTDAEEIFGFDFITQITNIAEITLIDQILKLSKNESEESLARRKNKFKSIINNIVNNPVITGLLRSNPITSVAHSIINQTMSAQSTQITDISITRGDYEIPQKYKDFKKSYTGFKESYERSSLVGFPESKRIILDESLDKFTRELKPLIKLFDDLSKINEKYESSLEVFMKSSEQTITRVKPIENEFYKILKTKNRHEARGKINQFFNVGENPSLELIEEKLNNKEMKSVVKYSNEVNEVLFLLKNDFLKIITLEIELAEEYSVFFKELKAGKEGLPKFENTESLDKKINQFEQLKSSLIAQRNKLEA